MIKRVRSILFTANQQFRKQINKDENIYLIYSMGKVGSSTIYKSLKQKKPYSDIFHVHFLSEHWLNNVLPGFHENFHSNIKNGNDILAFIKNNPKRKIKIITLTREPVMREISNLFENWKHIFKDIEEVKNEDLKDHIESLDYDYTLNWFDSEFFKYLDINIYNLPFDRSKGYEIYSINNIDILCVKLEILNEVYLMAFKEFIGSELDLKLTNTSFNKKEKDKYSYLKDNVKIKKDKLFKLYNSKYVRHFYSEKEINDFINKWS